MADPAIPATTIIAVVHAAGATLGIQSVEGTYEATDPLGLSPSQGNSVVCDYIPASGQWMISAIIV